MRKSILFTAFLFSVYLLQGQAIDNIAEGDVLVLGEPSGSAYVAIDFPRRNIIIKRGAIADFKALIGKKLIVLRIENEKNGNKIAVLKRKDGQNFFRFFPEVKANLSQALNARELTIPVG